MSLVQAIILGAIQGLTEFLPVSSSGHLTLAERLLAIKQPPVMLDSVLHLGTLLAVMVYFRRELAALGEALIRRTGDPGKRRLALRLLIASIPAGLVGLTFKSTFERLFQSVLAVGLMLMVTGALLWLAERQRGSRHLNEMSITDSVWVGIAQTFAIMPGLSRSGTTIFAGLWRGLDRESAARFSFLLSIPVISGAGLVALRDARLSGTPLARLAVGALVAFVAGYMAIGWLLHVIQRRQLRLLAIYCFIVGSLALAFYAF